MAAMNTQFNANVYCFTEEVFKDLLKNFEGKVVGEDGMMMNDIMKHFFGEFVPDKQNLVDPEEVEVKPSKKVKKKKVKDPTKPKRATTAFFYYTASIRGEVKALNPGKKVGELSKVHSQMWKELSEEDKQPFLDNAEEDKARYAKQMEEWKANNAEN